MWSLLAWMLGTHEQDQSASGSQMLPFGFDLLVVACVSSLLAGALIVWTQPLHARWTGDHADSGVQKHHDGSPPRVGLVPVLVGCLAALAVMTLRGQSDLLKPDWLLLACALPAALCGFLEDVTKKIRARWRLLAPTVGTVAAIVWLDATIPALGAPVLDTLLSYWPIAVLATVLMVVGFTQAMNIVDGLNGLSSGLAMLMLLATAWAAYGVHDPFITRAALLLAAAVLGFWLLNFPRGRMFLGDGGAYFLGFMLALLWKRAKRPFRPTARRRASSAWLVARSRARPSR